MLIFWAIILFFVLSHFIINLSVLKNKKVIFILTGLLSYLIYKSHLFALDINIKNIYARLNEVRLLSRVSVFIILEAFIGMVLNVIYLSNSLKIKKKGAWLAKLNSFSAIVIYPAVFVVQLVLFYYISGTSYKRISVFFSLSVFAIILILVFLLRLIKIEYLLEMKFYVLSFQLVAGMFLPFIAKDVVAPMWCYDFNINEFILLWLSILTIFSVSYFFNRRKSNK